MTASAVADTRERAIPRLALIGIFGGLLAGYLGLSAAIPVLPGYVRTTFGAPDFAVGASVTATALTALLTRPVFGMLADRHGHRRVMRFGALIAAAGGALYFAPIGLAGLVAVRLLLGVGEAALFTAGAVWTVSIAPRERRGQLIGLYGVAMWGGISAGTLIGAAFQRFGYDAVWAFCAAAPLAGFLLVGLAPVDGRHPGGAERPTAGRRGSLLPRPAILPGVALGLGAAGYAGVAAFVVLDLQSRGIHPGVLVLSCVSASYAGARLVVGHLPDRLGPRPVAAWCGVGEAAGLLIIAGAPDLPVAVIGGLVMGAGFSLLHPSLALMVMNGTDQERQGAAIGAYTSFWDLGLAVWGPVTGAVAAGLGYTAVLFVGATCAAGAGAMALAIGQRAPHTAAAA